MNQLFCKLLAHKNVLRVAATVTSLVVALFASVLGIEAGPFDGGP
jgi:hypothetical protein